MSITHSNIGEGIISKMLEKEHLIVYFIGIGGIGMSALAELCLDRGYAVFGTDRQSSEITERLTNKGADIKYASSAENITRANPSITVYTLSISEDNPEYRESLSRKIPTVSRAEFLGAIMKGYGVRIGVSGSHGKSTVTAMLQHVLGESGYMPTAIGGALFPNGSSYVKGANTHIVYEACEYGDSFLKFCPSLAVLLNLDFDHSDYFEDINALKNSFVRAANLSSKAVVLNADCENLLSIIDGIGVPVHTFSKKLGYTYRYATHFQGDGKYGFDLFKHEKFLESFSLNVIGEFNVGNAVAAAVAADVLGVPAYVSKNAISSFFGIPRRLEHIGVRNGVGVFYDYAHHPKEILAAYNALSGAGYKSIAAVFCPHTYTRTKSLFDEFADALGRFHVSLITEIYPAREMALPGVTSEALVRKIEMLGARAFCCSEKDVCELIDREKIDCLVLMGAGNLDRIKERINGRCAR